MRFAAVAASLLAVVAAESTVYTTEEFTVISCAATVTNCPARSTVVSTTSYPVITATSAPVWANTSTPVYPVSSMPASSPAGVATSAPASSSAPAYSLSTVTVSTCVPTVIYSTYTVFPTTAVASTGVMPHPTNGTAPVHTATPAPVTGAASGLQVSFGLAAVAAAAAMLI